MQPAFKVIDFRRFYTYDERKVRIRTEGGNYFLGRGERGLF